MIELQRFAFRVDGSVAIGIGHVMRCLAFAKALRETGAEVTFLYARMPSDIQEMLRAEGFEVVGITGREDQLDHRDDTPFYVDQVYDSRRVLELMEPSDRWHCVIVDHYGIDYIWEGAIRERSAMIVAIDDLANRAHECDVLLDQNLQPTKDRYREWIPQRCRQLLGPRFALLRPEFATYRARKAYRAGVRRVILFAGGGDPTNATGRLLDAWALLGSSRPSLDVIIGSAHPNRSELQERCKPMAGVLLHVQTERMAEILANADLFIGAAGSVSWERCCLGLPALMFSIAANQESNLQLLTARRTGISLGNAKDLDVSKVSSLLDRVLVRPKLLRGMGCRAANLVDGLGAIRAALLLRSASVTLREAVSDDDLLAWPWRNHMATRRYFRDPRELTLSEHRSWWSQSLRDDVRRLFIARCGTRDFGVVRLDDHGEDAEISIYINPEFTGLGLGSAALCAAQRWLAKSGMVWRRLQAEILPDNSASQKAFAKAGFHKRDVWWYWESDGK